VLRYLARYTHRVAISNHRLISLEDGKVTFRWKGYAHDGKQRKMALGATEFIRRFLLHVLPKAQRAYSSAISAQGGHDRRRCPRTSTAASSGASLG
jgi:hypothetical protein